MPVLGLLVLYVVMFFLGVGLLVGLLSVLAIPLRCFARTRTPPIAVGVPALLCFLVVWYERGLMEFPTLLGVYALAGGLVVFMYLRRDAKRGVPQLWLDQAGEIVLLPCFVIGYAIGTGYAVTFAWNAYHGVFAHWSLVPKILASATTFGVIAGVANSLLPVWLSGLCTLGLTALRRTRSICRRDLPCAQGTPTALPGRP